MQVLRQGAQVLNNYRLLGATIYVTLEPCLMCIGACLNARIKRVVFGAYAPAGMLSNMVQQHNLVVRGGVRAAECAQILQSFFRERRT